MSSSALPITLADVHALHRKVRTERPLVQSITNYVAMTVAANVLLAAGASPAMLHAAEEVEDFAQIAAALAVNIGTLSPSWVAGMKLAARRYRDLGKPWVLDPVAVGATAFRNRTAADLVALSPAVIRGNASEIMALAGVAGVAIKGADSTESSEKAVDGARSLARASGAVVAVTGEVDYVTDGHRTVAIESGHPLMPLSTALGCALTGLVAAFTAVGAPFEATVAALATYAAAGRIAGGRVRGPGHLPQELCDALFLIDLAALEANAHLEEI
jgi:hydroxyethylthiazole kinase